MIRREWAEPLVALGVEWAIFCALGGPVLATAGVVVCIAAGGPLARWVGRKMFGEGGQ